MLPGRGLSVLVVRVGPGWRCGQNCINHWLSGPKEQGLKLWVTVRACAPSAFGLWGGCACAGVSNSRARSSVGALGCVQESSASWNFQLPPPAQNSFVHGFYTVSALGQYALTGVDFLARWSFNENSPFASLFRNSSRYGEWACRRRGVRRCAGDTAVARRQTAVCVCALGRACAPCVCMIGGVVAQPHVWCRYVCLLVRLLCRCQAGLGRCGRLLPADHPRGDGGRGCP